MSSNYAIGIDVGGTSIKYGLADKSGRLLYSSALPADAVSSELDVIRLIARAVSECVEHAGGKQAVTGIGIGFPGIVENNEVHGGADNLPGFDHVALGDVVSAATGLPVVADNDANMMARGELMYGAALGCTDAVFLTVGTGIGGSLAINGELYGGYRNHGTELGHIIIKHHGRRCTCGGSGCLEAYASVSALIRDYTRLRPAAGNADGKYIISRYLAGEDDALQVMQKHFEYMASGVISFINIFSPQKIVLGGGITEAGGFYAGRIKENVLKTVMPATAMNTVLVRAALGNNAGILGSAGSVFSKLQ